ncbi:MAG: hydrogenase nickel incorporation protein HypB [Methanopyri archaeon]|nr:hydrogenase nickel incorporation protein HypB [Methanopyri archaeon]
MHKVEEVDVMENLIEANRRLAEDVRRLLEDHGIKGIEVMGSIGSGKTALVEELIKRNPDVSFAVLAGDVVSDYDEERYRKLNVPVVGLNTGRECHLDAHLVEHGLEHLSEEVDLNDVDVLFVENVGNLVCPTDFPLGMHERVLVVSATEGEDVIPKHPAIVKAADVIVVNKIDLAEACGVDVDALVEAAEEINPSADVFAVSVKTGEGLEGLERRLLG